MGLSFHDSDETYVTEVTSTRGLSTVQIQFQKQGVDSIKWPYPDGIDKPLIKSLTAI